MVDNLPAWLAIPPFAYFLIHLMYAKWISPSVDKDRSEHSGHNGTK